MMKLELTCHNSVNNVKTNLPLLEFPCNHRRLLKLHYIRPSFFVSNSYQRGHSNQSVAAIVFGDGGLNSESELYPLTKRRSKAAIPISVNYTMIDAVLSNCINSNINKIYALTQFNSTSLNAHLSKAYSRVCLGRESFVEVIAAYQNLKDQGWFQGTADAIRRCLWALDEYPVTEFLIVPGHHFYKMDYQKIIEEHRNSSADITIVGLSSSREKDPGFGLLQVDTTNQVVNFSIKSPKDHAKCIQVRSSNKLNGNPSITIPSIGIYVINRDKLVKLLSEYLPEANDFGSEVIPGALSLGMKIKAYPFEGYWDDMRSIGDFYRANMEFTKKPNMEHNFYNKDSPFFTMPRCLPPSFISEAHITDSVIGDGCILSKCNINRSVVGMRTRISDGVYIEDSIIMGADIYQTEDAQKDVKEDNIPIGIGENSRIKKAIIDKNARIGKNVMIMNEDKVEEAERESSGYIISSGIVVVLGGAVVPDGSIL